MEHYLRELREKLSHPTNMPTLETLSKYENFLKTLSDLELVEPSEVEGFLTSEAALKNLFDSYIESKRRIESVPDIARSLPFRFGAASESDFPPALWEKCERLSEGLYLTGKAGTGKTHLAVALMKKRDKDARHVFYNRESRLFQAKIGRRPEFISVPELLLDIRSTFNVPYREGISTTEGEIIERCTKRNLLVFDDLGAEKSSDWSVQTLYIIIDRRYRECCPTIITSNLSLDELSEKVGDRIASRIAGMCSIVTLTGKDRRVKK